MKKYLALLLLVGPLIPAHAATVKYNDYLANESGVAYAKTYPLNLNGYQIDWLSYQMVWSSANPAAVTFTDGSASTFSVTVASYTMLSTATASNFLTVLTTRAIPSGTSIVVNGVSLYSDVNWWADSVSTATTALSIKKGINTYVPGVVATSTFSVVTVTALQPGSSGNNMTLVSNTSSITVNSANFTGGADADCISINNTSICALRDFAIGASSAATAANLAAAIRSNAYLSTIVTSTAPGGRPGVVVTSATSVGANTNYATFSSSQNALTLTPFTSSGPTTATGFMSGGTNSAYTLVRGTATIIAATNPFSPIGSPTPTPMVALPVLYSTPSAVAITGLTAQTTYYVIPVTKDSFGLSATSTGAVAGLFLNLTSSRTSTTANSFTLTPLAYAGTASGFWQASNDGVNWGNLPVGSTITLNTVLPSTTTLADFGQIDYSWVRFNLNTPPTAGGLQLKIIPNGKRNQ